MKKVLSILLALTTIISSFAFAINAYAATLPVVCTGINVEYKANGRAIVHYKWKSTSNKAINLFDVSCQKEDQFGKYVYKSTKSNKNKKNGDISFNVPQGTTYRLRVWYRTNASSSKCLKASLERKAKVKLTTIPSVNCAFLDTRHNDVYLETNAVLPYNQGIYYQICDTKKFDHGISSTVGVPDDGPYDFYKFKETKVKLDGNNRLKLKIGKTYYIRYKVCNHQFGNSKWSSIKAFKLYK